MANLCFYILPMILMLSIDFFFFFAAIAVAFENAFEYSLCHLFPSKIQIDKTLIAVLIPLASDLRHQSNIVLFKHHVLSNN